MPGFTKHLISEVEKESEHRRKMDAVVIKLEDKTIEKNASAQRLGSQLAFIIAITFVLCGTIAALNGHEKFGIAVAGGI